MLYFGNWIGHHFFSLCNWGTNVEQCNCGTVKPSTELRVKNGRGISRKIGLAIKYLLQCAQSSFNLHSYCQISLSMCSTVHIVYSYCRIFLFVCTSYCVHDAHLHTCTAAKLSPKQKVSFSFLPGSTLRETSASNCFFWRAYKEYFNLVTVWERMGEVFYE